MIDFVTIGCGEGVPGKRGGDFQAVPSYCPDCDMLDAFLPAGAGDD